LIIASHKPGDTLTLSVLRGSQTLTIQVTLGTTS
jgi:S1-C subfamily serine protease